MLKANKYMFFFIFTIWFFFFGGGGQKVILRFAFCHCLFQMELFFEVQPKNMIGIITIMWRNNEDGGVKHYLTFIVRRSSHETFTVCAFKRQSLCTVHESQFQQQQLSQHIFALSTSSIIYSPICVVSPELKLSHTYCCLSHLSRRQRPVFVLYFQDSVSAKQAGERTTTNVTTSPLTQKRGGMLTPSVYHKIATWWAFRTSTRGWGATSLNCDMK